MPSFIKIVQTVKKLNSISRERLNFRRRPFLCTTLHRHLIGDSRDGQIDVCCLVAMVIWSWTSNVVNRGQNVPAGSTPTDTIGPRSRSRLSPRDVLVVLKWRKNRSTFKARRVFSFDFVQSDSFLCQPTDEHNRERFACESDHSRLATIILDVPVAVENLPVVWIAYYASEQLQWHIWPTFPLNFFMKFSQKMSLYLFYTMVQKSQKWPKTQIKGGGGGPALTASFVTKGDHWATSKNDLSCIHWQCPTLCWEENEKQHQHKYKANGFLLIKARG